MWVKTIEKKFFMKEKKCKKPTNIYSCSERQCKNNDKKDNTTEQSFRSFRSQNMAGL